MLFLLALVLVNAVFFLPGYFMNYRNSPGLFAPIGLLFKRGLGPRERVKVLYFRFFSDPFRLHFEFTALVLLSAWIGHGRLSYALIGLIGGFGWLVILYSSVMIYIFNRSPALRSDWHFLKTGLSIAFRYRVLVVLGLLVGVLGLVWLNYFFAKTLLTQFNFHPVAGGIFLFYTTFQYFGKKTAWLKKMIGSTILKMSNTKTDASYAVEPKALAQYTILDGRSK